MPCCFPRTTKNYLKRMRCVQTTIMMFFLLTRRFDWEEKAEMQQYKKKKLDVGKYVYGRIIEKEIDEVKVEQDKGMINIGES